jgi:hypothetical protein
MKFEYQTFKKIPWKVELLHWVDIGSAFVRIFGPLEYDHKIFLEKIGI